ncbi:hypothetical protein V491_00499 [Pseudogymnoascus sp. VKM F-3775]|nr:hypothetical protein V491_00499 [Pseudogymnoascus sp. VKM F-3775]
MDSDLVDFEHKCSEFDTNGDFCDRCNSAFSANGFYQLLESSQGFLHYDLATLKGRGEDRCPLCRALLGSLKGSRLYRRNFRDDSVYVVLRIQARPTCNGLSRGDAGGSPMHVLSISLTSVEFADVVQDIKYELDIFAKEDSPAARWILSRPPELDVTSPRTIAKAKAMISECQTSHTDCEAVIIPPKLPTRVINVHESTSSTVHLHVPQGSGEFKQYLTLSYCWGGHQPLVALTHNFDDLKSGIAIATLPQTLQDAVQTTRSLGYQYLWVDALCIIQDDNRDIAREIAAMADTYRNSTATILAAISSSVSESYLNYPREEPPFFTLTVRLPNAETAEIGISHPCQWGHFGWHLNPLSKRGWTFQEFLLARRIIFYGPYEVLFHCQSVGFTRLFPSYIQYPDSQQPSSRALFRSQERAASWSELVRQYTFRNLTFPEDRPQAIAGIVATLEEVWEDKCVFGAWISGFLEQMTWFNVAGSPFHPSLRRSDRAPSWSWLSVDGHVAIYCKSKLRSDCIITADLLEVSKGARLTLTCRVFLKHEWPILESNTFSINLDIEKTDESEGMPRFYLYLGSESPLSEQWHYAFALIVIEEETDVFRRIGVIKVHSRNIEVVKDLEQMLQPKRHITLI